MLTFPTRYLIQTYDKSHALLPTDPSVRWKAYEWLHASEGTFALHALAILYTRWQLPEPAQAHLPEMEKKLSANVHNDLNWIENTLVEQAGKGKEYLVGEGFTVADVMMQFTIEFIFTRELGIKGMDDKWPETRKWLKRCMDRPAFKKAVEKTGYTLESKGAFRT